MSGKRSLRERMLSIAELLMEKTEERMRKETNLSAKTLRMISLSEKLFSVAGIWE